MLTKEYTYINRTGWPHGLWDNEPDKVQWADKVTGLPCLAVRSEMSGHWCGYVGVAEGHPAFRAFYDDVDVSVHGGLTYGAFCRHDASERGICHLPEPGEPDQVWWLGFDCAHAGDIAPASWSRMGVYRTLQYVQEQCRELAAQLSVFPTGGTE